MYICEIYIDFCFDFYRKLLFFSNSGGEDVFEFLENFLSFIFKMWLDFFNFNRSELFLYAEN